MKKRYAVFTDVTVTFVTYVEADNEEEAEALAQERDISIPMVYRGVDAEREVAFNVAVHPSWDNIVDGTTRVEPL